MNNISSFVEIIAEKSKRLNPPEECDYEDVDGFLVCGKCHTRREMLISLPDSAIGNSNKEIKVRTDCDCRQAEAATKREEKQKQEEMEGIARLKKQSLIDEKIRDVSFHIYTKTNDNAKIHRLCTRYAEHFDEMLEKNQGLLFYGNVGTGKTFAAACIANYLLERNIPVVMTSFIKLIDSMTSFKEEDSALITRLNQAKLLIIDDLGAERGTDFALEKVYNIIDSRYRARLPLILTTNLSFNAMKNETDIRYARIYDRIFEVCYPMQFTGTSWRKSEAVKRYKDMKHFLEG